MRLAPMGSKLTSHLSEQRQRQHGPQRGLAVANQQLQLKLLAQLLMMSDAEASTCGSAAAVNQKN